VSLAKPQPVNSLNTVDFKGLIINSPEKQAAWKRVGFFLLTLIFWGVWLYLWTPLPELVAILINKGFSEISWRPATYVVVFFAMLFSLATWQIGWLHYNLARFKNRGRRLKQSLLSNHELGHFFTVDNSKLNNWQLSKCLVIQHNDTGEIQEIDVNELFSFKPEKVQPEVSEQQFQRYYVILIPDRHSTLLFKRVSNDFVVIMKVLCSSFNVNLIQCQPKTNHLALIMDIPENYNAEKILDQVKTASASIIKSKYEVESDLMEAGPVFWRAEQLMTTTKLTGHEIRQFFEKLVSDKQQAEVANYKRLKSVSSSKSSSLAKEFWQKSKRLVIENEETKRKTQIDINDFFVCTSLPVEDEQSEQNFERIFVVFLPAKLQHALFNKIGHDFRIIMKVLCSIFSIGLVDCIVNENHLLLALDIPEGYELIDFAEQLKKASTLIIEKKYWSESGESDTFTFWRDEQLVTTPELVDIEIKEFLGKVA
jgi:biofilm PGA synthesis protein PgaD